MKTITASKLRVEFASIIKDLDAGPVHITKHGKTIAVLTSPDAAVETPEEPVSMTTTPRAPTVSTTSTACSRLFLSDKPFSYMPMYI